MSWRERLQVDVSRVVDSGRKLLVPVEFMDSVMERLEELVEVVVSQQAEIAALRARVARLDGDDG